MPHNNPALRFVGLILPVDTHPVRNPRPPISSKKYKRAPLSQADAFGGWRTHMRSVLGKAGVLVTDLGFANLRQPGL
jgi:hypothetical protein